MTFEFFFKPKPDKALMRDVLGRDEGETRGMNELYEGKERRRRKGKKISLWRERDRGLWAVDVPAPNSELQAGGKTSKRQW